MVICKNKEVKVFSFILYDMPSASFILCCSTLSFVDRMKLFAVHQSVTWPEPSLLVTYPIVHDTGKMCNGFFFFFFLPECQYVCIYGVTFWPVLDHYNINTMAQSCITECCVCVLLLVCFTTSVLYFVRYYKLRHSSTVVASSIWATFCSSNSVQCVASIYELKTCPYSPYSMFCSVRPCDNTVVHIIYHC